MSTIEVKDGVIQVPEDKEAVFEDGKLVLKSKCPYDDLPKDWHDIYEVGGYRIDSSSNIYSGIGISNSGNSNVFKTQSQAKASIALAQLTQLYSVWNEGEEIDWSNAGQNKFAPYIGDHHNISTRTCWRHPNTFSFLSGKKCKKFVTTFEELLKQASPLLWGYEFED